METTLRTLYCKGLRKVIDNIFTEDTDNGLFCHFKANLSRFSAYKVHCVGSVLNRVLNNKKRPSADRKQLAKAVLNTFALYQDAE